MKPQIIIIFLVITLGVSCTDNNKLTNLSNRMPNDTVIGKRIINQGEGNIRNTVYFVVRNHDTSNLRYDFAQISSTHFEITIYDDKFLSHPILSYREEMHDLKRVLSEAANDFELHSLTRIWDISLHSAGDLAIAITKQLPPDFLDKPLNNLDVGRFLLSSKLTEDLNDLLEPYGKKIKKYIVEKAAFLDSSIFLKFNKIETPKSEIPSKILDAQIWPVIENNGG